jgi:hypothetical protein
VYSKWTGNEHLEGGADNSIAQEKRPGKNWQLAADLNHQLQRSDLYVSDGTRHSSSELESANLFAQSKWFIINTNGCSEHGMILSELLHNANRSHESLIVRAIDFTNAFGSVPHELIMSVMRQRRFPEWSQRIVASIYRGATSVIEVNGVRSEKIAWKREVKQGCSLSPLLFNLCLEPRLQALNRFWREMGAFVGPAEDRIGFSVQAYADDVILISKRGQCATHA